jgi:hypothetical protein
LEARPPPEAAAAGADRCASEQAFGQGRRVVAFNPLLGQRGSKMNERAEADISAAEVAAELIRFVERILVALEVTLADALADERLRMSEVRLLMALERHDYGAAEVLAHSDHAAQDLPGRLRGLMARGLIEPAGRDSLRPPELTLVGREVLARLDRASRVALAQLISGLDGPQRLRLQGAMHLVSDHFGLDALRATRALAPWSA